MFVSANKRTGQYLNLNTKSTQSSLSEEVNIPLGIKNYSILWSPKVPYGIQNSPPLLSVHSRLIQYTNSQPFL